MTKLGAAMAGGNPSEGRMDNDYYPTPIEATIGLLDHEYDEIRRFGNKILEPACGDGAMAEVLIAQGFEVISTDLIDRGYGSHGVDFLDSDIVYPNTPIVTNPPFALAPQFIRRALEDYQAPYLALLLKSTFWHAASRYQLFIDHPPSVVYPLTWRPDFMKRGAPTMDVTWFVWDRNRTNTLYKPIRKPKNV